MSHKQVRVKICGVTNRADAEASIELGADAIGLNFYPRSKRYLDLRAESGWISELPLFVTRVAVLVNPSLAEAEAVFGMRFIDAVQFHGDEDEAFCAHFAGRGLPFMKAIALRNAEAVVDVERFHTKHILLDAYAPGQYGGTGRLVDLDLAAQFAADHPEVSLILSGGLTPENVAEAVRRIRPFAVDVASGVEREPRRKDHGLVRTFIEAAQSA